MLAYLLSLSLADRAPSAVSEVRGTANTLAGIGAGIAAGIGAGIGSGVVTSIGLHRPTEPDLAPEAQRTVGASAMAADAEGTTPVPDMVVSERPGASPLTLQLRLLDAYLRQVKQAEVPLALAVPRDRR